MKTPRALYSIDWLQCFCIRGTMSMDWEERISTRADMYGHHRTYRMTKSDIYMAGYREVRSILYKNYEVAIIAWEPSDERRRKDGAAIKLANPVLYVTDWYFILMDILSVLGWTIHNLTRVDLACDLNYFVGGLLPSTFIRNYVSKVNHSYIRHGSNKWACYGRKEMRTNVYDSIRWGSRASGVSVYLYNKSKELREQKNKPWIKAAWEKAELSTTKDVWRVEISITSQGLGLKRIADNCFHTLFIEDLQNGDMVKDMFLTFSAVYFKFFRTDKEAKRKRDLKEIELIPRLQKPVFKPHSLCENVNCGRMEKIVANKLAGLYDYLLQRDFQDKIQWLQKIGDVERIYAEMHYSKAAAHAVEDALIREVEDDVMDVLGKKYFDRYKLQLRQGHRHYDVLKKQAVDLAEEIIDTNFRP